jgi:ribonucleotide monophosphatase NagD (HAD superfamily)
VITAYLLDVCVQVLAIGDSLEHDIAGAAAAGIDCLFIAGGIHAAELLPGRSQGAAGNGGSCDWDQIGKDALQRLCGERAANPTYAVPFLSW